MHESTGPLNQYAPLLSPCAPPPDIIIPAPTWSHTWQEEIAALPCTDKAPPLTPHTTLHNTGSLLPQHRPDIFSIFYSHVPILTHVPVCFRKDIPDALRDDLFNIRTTATADETSHAFSVFCLLPSVLIASSVPEKTSASAFKATYRRKFDLWRQKQYNTMWSEVLVVSRPRPPSQSELPILQQNNARRAIRYTKEGAFGKATQVLSSHGVHTPTRGVQDILLQKHPQEQPDTDASIIIPDSNLPPLEFVPFTMDEVRQVVRACPKGSGAGGSGLSPTHVREIIDVPSADDSSNLEAVIAKIATQLASGNIHGAIEPCLSSARLTPLLKHDNDVRPVAVDETLQRILSSMLMCRVSAQARDDLQPMWVGVATPGGCEAILHVSRRILHLLGSSKEYGLLQVDFQNTINLVN